MFSPLTYSLNFDLACESLLSTHYLKHKNGTDTLVCLSRQSVYWYVYESITCQWEMLSMATSVLVTSRTNKTKVVGSPQTKLLYQTSVDPTTNQNRAFCTIILYLQEKTRFFLGLCGGLMINVLQRLRDLCLLSLDGSDIWECVVLNESVAYRLIYLQAQFPVFWN